MILLGVGPQTTTMVDRRPPKFKGAQAPPRRREALLAEPRVAFTTKAVTVQKTSPELMAMDLVSELLGWTGDLETPRLAPPVLEWVTADPPPPVGVRGTQLGSALAPTRVAAAT